MAHCGRNSVSSAREWTRERPHLDTDTVLEDGVGGIDGDLVVGLVAVLKSEVVVLDVDVEEGKDELVLDLVPAAEGRSGEPADWTSRGRLMSGSRVGEGKR